MAGNPHPLFPKSRLIDEETVSIRNGDDVPLLGSVLEPTVTHSKWACPEGLPTTSGLSS
ncbi:hypothetical protein DPMN_077533 [Dreissena polymorpha]|uniref:Uncharacterized protein n=1 Tax=Dreissena polymorpha TaxID=45954 RepID=A0A9D3YKM4_DREPO|nr:hypothetical protein DPMN_077533 [Dreissena polymorpha]